jgi:uncharacterized membrane protein
MIAVREKRKEINVSDVEHIAALSMGGVLFLAGLRKGGLVGSVLKISGFAMIYRGQQGYRPLYNALGLKFPATQTGLGRYNMRVESSIVIGRPKQELYRIWRNLSNLPVFMDHLLSVSEIDDERSLWVAKAPGGMVVKWDAMIINDIEDELIAWSTVEGSGVDHAGSVRFSDTEDGRTRVTIVMRYDPPADQLGYLIGKLFGNDPQKQIERDLRRFKEIMELGARAAIA